MTAMLPAMVLTTAVFVTRARCAERAASRIGWTTRSPSLLAGPTATTSRRQRTRRRKHARGLRVRAAATAGARLLRVHRQAPAAIVSEFDSAGIARTGCRRARWKTRRRLDASRARIKRVHARLNDYEARYPQKRRRRDEQGAGVEFARGVKADFVAAVRDCGGEFVPPGLAFVALQRRTLDRGR
jgi:hypothetical protein